MKEKWKALMGDHKSLRISILLSLFFFLFYQISLNHLRFGLYDAKWSILPNAAKLWNRPVAPFLWEPIAVVQFPAIQWFLSPLNVLMGLTIAFLFLINLQLYFVLKRNPKLCRFDEKAKNPLLRILPAFLTGLACCAPAFLIPLASIAGSSIVFFVKARIFFIPLTFLFLGYGIIRGLQKMIAK
ncbi:hypothetical protein SANA_04780 [Gottschalkiaceae bacterium SANA]|nr:hypothetical protein SANA_04780 [Gottschalkiaceae bacterium SANA]